MPVTSVISDPNYLLVNSCMAIGHEDVVIFETRGPNVVQQMTKTSVNHVFRHDTNTRASFDVIFGANA
jgi:hypothetical protein